MMEKHLVEAEVKILHEIKQEPPDLEENEDSSVGICKIRSTDLQTTTAIDSELEMDLITLATFYQEK